MHKYQVQKIWIKIIKILAIQKSQKNWKTNKKRTTKTKLMATKQKIIQQNKRKQSKTKKKKVGLIKQSRLAEITHPLRPPIFQ